MSEIHQSASAEANGVKVADNTVNFNLTQGRDAARLQGWTGLVRTIAPVWYEERESRALSVKISSLIDTARRLQESFPAMSEERALMVAIGYQMTNEQAENLFNIFEKAQGLMGDEVHKGVSPEVRDSVVEGAKSAYDETVQSMWAKLVAGESSSPGSFSKKTIAILSEMGSADALLFSRLCGFCMTLEISVPDIEANKSIAEMTYDPVLLLFKDNGRASYNFGRFTVSDLSKLETLGLVSTILSQTVNVPSGVSFPYRFESEIALLSSTGEGGANIRLNSVLTQYGKELSRLCGIGHDSEAFKVLESLAAMNGVKVERIPRKTSND